MNYFAPSVIKYAICLMLVGQLSTFCSAAQAVQNSTTLASMPLVKKDPDKDVINIASTDNFMLNADYFPGRVDMGGVLLLHDCQNDRLMYDKLGRLLKQQGLHALALDFRGYGNSQSEKFSHHDIKKNSKDIVSYQNDVMFLASFWPKDVMAAFLWLREKVHRDKQISVISCGCSAKEAVGLADNMHINSLVLLSPDLDFIEKENYKNLNDIASFFIAASRQVDSYKTSQELFQWNGANNSKLQIYNDSRSGSSLLLSDSALTSDIVHWLKDSLR
jgi:hypothetical protein